MNKLLTTSASVLALSAFALFGASGASAADMQDPGCSVHGLVELGYMATTSSMDEDSLPESAQWSTPFGEGAGLLTCDAWNFQADMASYAHSADFISGKNLDDTRGHFGGAAFWRDSNVGSFGVSASLINTEVFGKENDYWRAGAFGEMFASDQISLGGGAHYFVSQDDIVGKDHKGWELTANAKFYATPNFSLMLQGDYMNSKISGEDFNGWAATGEARYLISDQGLSLFAGGRYAKRTLDGTDINDLQGYAGLTFAFNSSGMSLAQSDRSGRYDNTSTMLEKLPGPFGEILAIGAKNNVSAP